MRQTVMEDLKLAYMDLDKEIYKIKKNSLPNTEYIIGLLGYIEKLQGELQSIPCNTSGGCICLDRDWNNGTFCKIYGLNYQPTVGCQYYCNIPYYKELIGGRREI